MMPWRTVSTLTLALALLGGLGTAETEATALREHFTRASPISWPAGTYSLQDMLTKLTLRGEVPQVRIGVDTSQRRALPAFAGTFWEAVILVATRWDTALSAPPAVAANNPSRLRHSPFSMPDEAPTPPALPSAEPLVARPPTTGERSAILNPQGPLLLAVRDLRSHDARRLGGHERWAQFAVDLRFEPGIRVAAIRSAKLRWQGDADPEHGPSGALLTDFWLRASSRPDQRLTTVKLDVPRSGNPAGPRHVALDGELELVCAEPLELGALLEPNRLVRLERPPWTFTVYWKVPREGPVPANADAPPFWLPDTAIGVAITPCPDEDLAPRIIAHYPGNSVEASLQRRRTEGLVDTMQCTYVLSGDSGVLALPIVMTAFGPKVTLQLPLRLAFDLP